MNNNNNYWNKRNIDMRLEENLAAYADRYFFARLSCLNYTYERIPWDDAESRMRQLRGEDVVLHRRNYPDMVIDEKAKVYGLINKVIGYPSFEILCKDKSLGNFFESWFVSPRNTTTHYAMISISSDKTDEKTLLSGDIRCMVYGLINVGKLKAKIEEETGKTLDQIKEDAWKLLEDYQNNQCPDYRDECLVYSRDEMGKAIYLKISPRKFEMPVNLVVRRDILRKFNLITEIYIDSKHLKRFEKTDSDDLVPVID